ncbi:MAG: SusC/RagA family TonB-linked outer membrane protein [Tannerellaceae bacterium]
MRICLLFLICSVMQSFATTTYSQSTALTFKLNNVPIEEVLSQIEEQSEFRFLYNKKMVDVERTVSISAKAEKVTNILNQLFKDEDVSYIISDRQIVLNKASDYSSLRSANQKGRRITGTVKDKNGETIPGANIIVKGTTNGVITNIDGNYTIEVPEGKSILQASFVGYRPLDMTIGNKVQLDFILAPSVEELSEVVVTAMGIRREKKALGYAMQEVKTEGLIENRSESVANMLQGKVAGVQISQSGTGMGGSTRVVMRGLNSLSGNNQPLWVVDGMPINDGAESSADQWGSIDYSGGASEINPEDIESISVLKGANAAALYGSRAQNGVILVVTKKGKLDQPISLEYNGNLNFSTPYEAFELQDVYGQGSNGQFASEARSSWGPVMDGKTEVPNWRATIYKDDSYKPYAFAPQHSQMMDFYRTGLTYNNSLSVSAGGKSLAGRISYSDSRNQGITPHHSLTRQYFDANLNFSNKWLVVGMKANYIRQKGVDRPDQGEYGIANQFIKMPRSIRMCDLQSPAGFDGQPVNWSGTSNEYINPYAYFSNGNGNKDMKNRIIGQLNASVIFTEYLRLNAKIGLDWYNMDRRTMMPFSFDSGRNQYMMFRNTFEEFNSDVLLNFNKTFGDFSVVANAGVAFRKEKGTALSASSGRFTVPGLVAMSNEKTRECRKDLARKRSIRC